MHRVISISNEGGTLQFRTKGDANNAPDEEAVLADNVVGKEIFNIPKVGWVAVVIKGFFSG